jgi:hypothetical protein
MNLWAVIPSKDRPEMLAGLCTQLFEDGVRPVVIDTGYEPELTDIDSVDVIRDITQPPNISRWWNLGLDYIRTIENYDVNSDEYVVAVLNDDLRVSPGFVQKLADTLVSTHAAAAYPDQFGLLGPGRVWQHTIAEPIDLRTRMCGYAFALRGSANLRADENLAWWYGDDDLDWRARQAGGSVLVGGLQVEHLCANQTTVGTLAEQAGRDRQTFIDKWGRAPW